MIRRRPGTPGVPLAGALAALVLAGSLLSPAGAAAPDQGPAPAPFAPAVPGPRTPGAAVSPAGGVAAAAVTYADLADLADRAPTVVRAQIAKAMPIEPARAPGVRPGWVRMYVEARTTALLSGPPLTGDSLRYLVDVPLDSRGKPPKLPRIAKRGVILFARTVADRPGELQLIAPDAQLLWDESLEARLKAVLTELLAPGAPGRINAVREAIYVPGNLAGEGETQLFLATPDGEPASISVIHQAGKAARWSVSFSEVVDASGEPPARDTLAWYRLACFLPPELPAGVNVSGTDADRAQAAADYRLVREGLGECPRSRS
jgi:hypothetical protein